MRQPRVHLFPGSGHRGPVAGSRRGGGHLRPQPGRRVRERQFSPCLGRPTVPGWRGGAGSRITRSLRSSPRNWAGRVRELVSKPGHVIASINGDQDGRITVAPVPGGDQPGNNVADLRGGDLGHVVIRPRRTASSTAVHDVRPLSSAAMTEYGQPGLICAWPLPAHTRGRTSAPGWSPRPAAVSCSHPPQHQPPIRRPR